MSIDWSKAPEGVTHVCEDDLMYPFRKRENGCWWVWAGSHKWIFVPEPMVDGYKPVTEYPDYMGKVCAWNGDGLPPVGTVCEGHVKNGGDWGKYKIIATSNDYMIVFDEESAETPIRHIYWEFRPIRTAEQIAAEERTKAIDDMVRALGMDEPGTAEYIRCGLIYDAGYRKQVQP